MTEENKEPPQSQPPTPPTPETLGNPTAPQSSLPRKPKAEPKAKRTYKPKSRTSVYHTPRLDDDKIRASFLVNLAKCASVKMAAASINMNRSTVNDYARNNPEFAEAISMAKARFAWKLVREIHETAKGSSDWRRLAWMLERLCWADFGKRDPTAITIDRISAAFFKFMSFLRPLIVDPELQNKIETRIVGLISDLTPEGEREDDEFGLAITV